MKKWLTLCLALATALSLAACGAGQSEYDIKIVVPAGSTEEFVYSHEEISPRRDSLILSSGQGLGDTEVVLKPVQVKEKTAYEPAYLTPSMPVEMAVERGAWFQVGVNVQNPTEEDVTVYVTVRDVSIRIE